MEADDLVVVYTVANPIKAEIIKNYLQSEGISCMLDGANQAGEVGLIAFDIKLLVKASDGDRAAKLIANHEELHKE